MLWLMLSFLFAAAPAQQGSSYMFYSDVVDRVDLKDNFRAEPLGKSEIEEIEKAGKVLDEAQQNYNAAVNTVKYHHGESIKSSWGMRVCGSPVVSVELRGHFALISTEKSTDSCATMVYTTTTAQ